MKLLPFFIAATAAVQVLAPVDAQPLMLEPLTPKSTPAPMFTEAERARIVAFWSVPGRYSIGPRANAERDGAFAVRLTPAASLWFRAYSNALRPGKTPPTATATPTDTRTAQWEIWVAAKVAHDHWAAQQAAARANARPALGTTATPAATTAAAPEPPLPGLIPADLLAAVGNPPPFAATVAPLQHTVMFEDGLSLSYHDHLAISSPRYAYYRFDEGVASEGTPLSRWPQRELAAMLEKSGLTRSESRVIGAVSRLEGGFDAVNTYDTGFVSVGFIQFASLSEGGGSLGPVLRQEKLTRPQDFEIDFRRFGLDVDDASLLVAIDPATGAEVRGPDANRTIIADKRLVAAFQRAGQTSAAFRAAQIQEAKRRFYPADATLAVNVNGQVLTSRVRDVVRSEAGMATLFDRSVNLGNFRLLSDEVARLMRERGLTRLDQVPAFERELIKRLKWRADFLSDTTLSQPR
jgi:hypothetical protein